MPTAAHTPSDATLILPWNRTPNYLIGLVALINLLAGIAALGIAARFAKDISSFDNAVATVFIALFGLLLISVAWWFRTGMLPVRFVADAANRECGFRWGPWWNGRFDLTGADRLIGELRPHRDGWRWAILIPGHDPGQEPKWIYGSSRGFESEGAATQACTDVIGQLGEHLSLPTEILR